jgi:hypothetical protein
MIREVTAMVAAVIGAAIAVVAFVLYMWAIWKYTINRAALGVVRALRRNPGQAYTVRVHKRVPVGAWNPSQSLRRRAQVFGDGTATYRLDGTDRVTLTWTPRTGVGRDYTGDIPPQIDTGHPEQHKRAVVLRLTAIVYAIAAVGGFAAGYTVSSGAPGRRVGFGLAGVFVAMIVLWFVITAILVAHGTRKVVGHRHRHDTAH